MRRRRLFPLLLLALSGSAPAACLIDAVTVPDAPLSYLVLKPGTEKREVTVLVTCDRAQDRYQLLLAGSIRVQSGGWEAELQPRQALDGPLRVALEGAAEVFGPGVTFGGDWGGGEGPRTYTHKLTLRAEAGQWAAAGSYVSDLRVAIHDL